MSILLDHYRFVGENTSDAESLSVITVDVSDAQGSIANDHSLYAVEVIGVTLVICSITKTLICTTAVFWIANRSHFEGSNGTMSFLLERQWM